MASDSTLSQRISGGFSGYDFFGYLLPGAALLAAMLLSETLIAHYVAEVSNQEGSFLPLLRIADLAQEIETKKNWPVGAMLVSGLLAFTYIVGHLVASVSGILIDRGLVAKAVGYPTQRLIFGAMKPDSDRKHAKPIRRAAWRAAFIWGNGATMIAYMVLFCFPDLHPCARSAALAIALALACVVALGFFLSLLEACRDHKSERHGKTDKIAEQTSLEKSNPLIRIGGEMLIFCSYPFSIVALVVGSLAGTSNKLDVAVKNSYKAKFESRFGHAPCPNDTNLYWLPLIWLRRHDPWASRALENWLYLYSFSRNLATALYVASFYSATLVYLQPVDSRILFIENADYVRRLPAFFFLVATTALFRYYYLYADYYSRYLIRAFATSEESSDLSLKERSDPPSVSAIFEMDFDSRGTSGASTLTVKAQRPG